MLRQQQQTVYCNKWPNSQNPFLTFHFAVIFSSRFDFRTSFLAKLELIQPESWWLSVFCVNTGGRQLGFIAEIKGHSGQVQPRDLWVPLGEIAEHPAALSTSIKVRGTAKEWSCVSLLIACHSWGRSDTSEWWIGLLCFCHHSFNLKTGIIPALKRVISPHCFALCHTTKRNTHAHT